jgi:hypothetical protein
VRNSAQPCQKIDPGWRYSKLNYDISAHQVVGSELQSIRRSAEFGQGSPDPFGILTGWLDPDIEILSCPNDAVRGQRVCTDDKKSNLCVEKGRQEVKPVVCHESRTTATGISEREYAGHGRPVNSHTLAERVQTSATRSSAESSSLSLSGASTPRG